MSQAFLIVPRPDAAIARVLTTVFLAHAAASAFALRTGRGTLRTFTLITSTVDLLCAVGTLMVVTPASWFFASSSFVLAAAAFRWGLRGTVATSAVAIALVFAHEAFSVDGSWPMTWSPPSIDIWRAAERGAYLALMGALLGYLAEQERRLRVEAAARAGGLERAHISRELHDGVLQSMVSVELQLQVLRGRQDVRTAGLSDELLRLQNVVRHEATSLRELMQQMRPVEFEPDQLLDRLADIVRRFERDTGITAQFLADPSDVDLPRRVCFELARIVQEGLVNVRKHSGAKHAVVRFSRQDNHWVLEIEDNGCGFPFDGRLLAEELDASHHGPTIIRERVKAAGGQLTVESAPGRGSRLKVLVPLETNG